MPPSPDLKGPVSEFFGFLYQTSDFQTLNVQPNYFSLAEGEVYTIGFHGFTAVGVGFVERILYRLYLSSHQRPLRAVIKTLFKLLLQGVGVVLV